MCSEETAAVQRNSVARGSVWEHDDYITTRDIYLADEKEVSVLVGLRC